ncbi:unannotated protein [freshwater metagenome]|uniref:Unannotated protein n=1 Tax=freshwater metagenome TaxID=449393 RepID=A0A6J7J4H1_9ZZZZ
MQTPTLDPAALAVQDADELTLRVCEEPLRRVRRSWRDAAAAHVAHGARAIHDRATPDALTITAAAELQGRLRPLALAALAGRDDPVRGLRLAAPSLDAHLARRLGILRAAGDELLDRLARDEALLPVLTGGTPLGPVVAVDGAGDPHAAGRRTSVLRDDAGTGVVLKPRSLGPDLAIDLVLASVEPVAPGGAGPRLPPTIDRGTHAWQRLVAAGPCPDGDAEVRLLERAGVLLAVLHATRSGDVHADNVVLTADHVVPIDLECALQPTVGGPDADRRRGVERTGLLPHLDPVHGRDLSPLGPWLADRDAAPERVRDVLEPALLRGFDAAWEHLVAARTVVDGPAAEALAAAPVRVVARPTMAYDLLLAEIVTSGALGADDAPAVRARLRPSGDRPDLAPLARHEADDLVAGDVPLFTGRAGSTDLRHGTALLSGVLRAGAVPSPAEAARSADRPRPDELRLVPRTSPSPDRRAATMVRPPTPTPERRTS